VVQDVHTAERMKTPTSVRPELRLLPVILSVVLVGMGAAISGLYSLPMLALFLGTTPVALVLLWMTRDVAAPEDRIAAVDLERAKRAPASEPRDVAHSQAA